MDIPRQKFDSSRQAAYVLRILLGWHWLAFARCTGKSARPGPAIPYLTLSHGWLSEFKELFHSSKHSGCRMLNKYKLTDRGIRPLQAAGWSESRAVDTQSMVACLQRQGYEIGLFASDVLSNCMGLEVKTDQRMVEIDPVSGLHWLSNESPQYIQAFMKEPACPVGYGPYMVILMGVSGRFALLKNDWIGYQDADDLGEVFERLLFPWEYPLRWHDLARAQRPPDL